MRLIVVTPLIMVLFRQFLQVVSRTKVKFLQAACVPAEPIPSLAPDVKAPIGQWNREQCKPNTLGNNVIRLQFYFYFIFVF